jgi:hypothetical protein
VSRSGALTAPRTGLYLPSDWGGISWKAARKAAAAGTGLARVAVVTDSTGRFFASDLLAKGWVGLVKAGLQAVLGDGGSGFLGTADLARIAGQPANAYGAGKYVDLTGTWWLYTGAQSQLLSLQGAGAQGSTDGPGFGCIANQAANGGAAAVGTATFFPRGRFITVTYGVGFGAGTAAWTIDAVAQTPLDLSGAPGMRAVAVDLGPGGAANHTVVITTNATANNYLFLMGVKGSNPTGCVVDHYGRNGIRTKGIAGQTAGNLFTDGTDTTSKWNGGAATPCDLLVLGGGLVNDALDGVTGDVSMTNLRTYLNGIKDARADGGPDVLFIAPPIGHQEPVSRTYSDAMLRLRGFAEEMGAGLIDLWPMLTRSSFAYGTTISYWGDSLPDGLPGADAVHAGDTGMGLFTNAVLPVLLG